MLHEKEQLQQSQHAPGPVSSDEFLLRLLFYPDHVDDNGKLKPEGISRKDLQQVGFSVQRQPHVERSKIEELVATYCEKVEGREFSGIGPLLCGDVRNIKDDNDDSQAFYVLDDAHTESNRAHAIVLLTKEYKPSKQKKFRRLLCDIFRDTISIGKLFA